jgi:hypothetical protein
VRLAHDVQPLVGGRLAVAVEELAHTVDQDFGAAARDAVQPRRDQPIEHLLRACVRDREAVPAARSLDVRFHEYMADQKAVIRRVYAMSGLPLTAEVEARIDGYLAANPRGKHGQVAYDLAGDFGVDVAALRRRFAFYCERFGVRPEPTAGEAA